MNKTRGWGGEVTSFVTGGGEDRRFGMMIRVVLCKLGREN